MTRVASNRFCARCGGAVRLLDSGSRKGVLSRGSVIAMRIFRCLAPDCGESAKTIEVSIGATTKDYVRDRSEARGASGYEQDDSVLVEDAGHGLCVVRL